MSAVRPIAWRVATTAAGNVTLELVAAKGEATVARTFARDEVADVVTALIAALDAAREGYHFEERV